MFGRKSPPLPPAHLLGGVGLGDYWEVGERTVALIEQLAGIRRSDRVLDVGCGLARVAWPLARRLGGSGSYVGFDAAEVYVDWCRQHVPLPRRRFHFVHADIRSSTYNADGAILPEHFVFPWTRESFDLVIATSVFTHLLPDATRHYLAEISRCLRRGGRIFASFFLLDELGWAAQKRGGTYPGFSHRIEEGMLHDSEDPEHGVAYEETWVAASLELCGLRTLSSHPGMWKSPSGLYYQDIVVAQKA